MTINQVASTHNSMDDEPATLIEIERQGVGAERVEVNGATGEGGALEGREKSRKARLVLRQVLGGGGVSEKFN